MIYVIVSRIWDGVYDLISIVYQLFMENGQRKQTLNFRYVPFLGATILVISVKLGIIWTRNMQSIPLKSRIEISKYRFVIAIWA